MTAPEDFPQLDAAGVAETLLAAMHEAERCQFEITATVVAAGGPAELTLRGTMQLHESGHDLQASFDLDSSDGRPVHGNLLIVDGIRYVRGGNLLTVSTEPVSLFEWIRVSHDPDVPESLVRFLDEIESEADPLMPLRLLAATSRLQALGMDELLRDQVMRYDGTIDMTAELESTTDPESRDLLEQFRSAGLSDLPLTLTVDRDNLPREFDLALGPSGISFQAIYRSWGGVSPLSAPEQYLTWEERGTMP